MIRKIAIVLAIFVAIAAIFWGGAWCIVNVDWSKITTPEYLPDGSVVYKVELDGHQYLKTEHTLTHSAACPCMGMQPAER